MAKKKELTEEERLEQALVPESEWPYVLPEGWEWVRLGDVCSFKGGGTPSKSNPGYWNGKIPWASIKDIKGDELWETMDYITEEGVNNSSTNICQSGKLIIATRIDPGKTIISKIDTAINQDLKIVETELNSKFLHYFFQSIRPIVLSRSSGSTVLGINLTTLKNIFLPLPSDEVQKQIANQIENLFSKLDEAKEKVESVLESSKNRKSAILHQAFTGELTKKWREENRVSLDSWKKVRLNEVLKQVKEKENDFSNEDMIYIGLEHLEKDKGIIGYTSVKGIKSTKTKFKENHILYGRLRPYLNKHDISNFEGVCSTDILVFESDENVVPQFINYFFDHTDFKKYAIENSSGINLPRVSAKSILEYKIKLPTEDEQREVIKVLDRLMNSMEYSNRVSDGIIKQINLVREAILAKVFRGSR